MSLNILCWVWGVLVARPSIGCRGKLGATFWGWNSLRLGTGAAAHAFKFSSLFGKILSELATVGATDYFIEPYRVDRPILQEADPARNFMF